MLTMNIRNASENSEESLYGDDVNNIMFMSDTIYENLGSDTKNLGVKAIIIGKDGEIKDFIWDLEDRTVSESKFHRFLYDMECLSWLKLLIRSDMDPDEVKYLIESFMYVYEVDAEHLDQIEKVDSFLGKLGIVRDYPIDRKRYNMKQTLEMGYIPLAERIANGNFYS